MHLCQSIAERWLKKEAWYIILSHTWEGDELTYKNFFDSEQRTRRSRSYDKLKHFCTIAHEEFGAGYAWADTVCIDKSSSTELDESIRSMFAWYRKSHACLIYLSRSLSLRDLAGDRWFTRGWTLQELLAPRLLKFYNKNWQPLTHLPNDKRALGRRPERPPAQKISQLESAILRATGISMNDIIDFEPGFSDDLAKRMRWIARRNTTRAEDRSYCMMGIFGVSMSVAYGEGPKRAFFRLFETILKVSSSPDLFLWAGKPVRRNIHTSYMIPSSPDCFTQGDLPYPTADFQWEGQRNLLPPREPITLTNVGLSMSILAVPEVQLCSYEDPGKAFTKTMLLKTALSDDVVKVTLLNDEWISFRVYNDGSRSVLGEFAFGVCNFTARSEGSRPCTPHRLWVVLLYRRDARERWRRLSTRDVITFECAQRLRYKELEPCHVAGEWTGTVVGSSWKLPGTPQATVTLQTLYL
ncbi:hypothetical protein HD554DRAFT_2030532 [Boletus coccyginus]|nr:hypothetical protein HD554DRAFT_2030532 [Boletus coccyginus]